MENTKTPPNTMVNQIIEEVIKQYKDTFSTSEICKHKTKKDCVVIELLGGGTARLIASVVTSYGAYWYVNTAKKGRCVIRIHL